MARTNNLSNYLTDVATAIKNKKGNQTPIKASDFDTEITNLPSGGGDIYDYFVEEPINSFYSGSNPAIVLGLKKIPRLTNTTNATSVSHIYTGCEKAEEIDVSGLNTANATDFSYLFHSCRALKSINLDTFDFSKARNFAYMFYNCVNLKEIDFTRCKNLESSSLTSVYYMFYGTACPEIKGLNRFQYSTTSAVNLSGFITQSVVIKKIDISSMGTIKINSSLTGFINNNRNLEEIIAPNFNVISYDSTARIASSLFSYNDNLKKMDLSSWVGTGISNVSNLFTNNYAMTEAILPLLGASSIKTATGMFSGCTSLQKIDIRSLDLTNLTSYSGMFGSGSSSYDVPYNCQIIVKDQTSKDWMTEKFPQWTNVVIASELSE